MNILVLGGNTSLGKAFCIHLGKVLPKARLHLLREEDFLRNSATLIKAIPSLKYAWIVNCFGRNRLDKIGETKWVIGSPVSSFTNSLLVDNVMPIYWVVNELVRRGHLGARVLSVASQTHRTPQTNTAIYCASKAALVMLSKVMARELAERGWVINCIAPGKISDTKMAEKTDEQVQKLRSWSEGVAESYALRNVPMRRFTTKREVCEAMFAILQNLPPYVNGTCIDMTGGA